MAANRALIIALSAYGNSWDTLRDPPKDAQLIQQVISRDYIVSEIDDNNGSRDLLLKKWSEFLKTISSGDTVLVYYSGHGMGVNGQDYIVPTDVPSTSDITDAAAMAKWLVSIGDLTEDVEARQVGMQIWLIDACRDNPVGKAYTRSGSTTAYLTQPRAYAGAFMMYSATAGFTALDHLKSDGDKILGSPYARAFSTMYADYKSQLLEIFSINLQSRVEKDTIADNEQIPVYEDGLDHLNRNFCMVDCDSGSVGAEISATAASATTTDTAVPIKLVAHPPADKLASVYIGKYSARTCASNTVSDAYPFGCATLKDVSAAYERAGWRAGIFVDYHFTSPISQITANTLVNVRAGLPVELQNDFIYDCKIGEVKQGGRVDVTDVYPYATDTDVYFFALTPRPPSDPSFICPEGDL